MQGGLAGGINFHTFDDAKRAGEFNPSAIAQGPDFVNLHRPENTFPGSEVQTLNLRADIIRKRSDHAPMCNAYRIQPKRNPRGIEVSISEEIQRLPSTLVRRTARGVVVTLEGADFRPATMRWGFHRPFSDAINNARSDKFGSPTWKESLALRRCLVPISKFYEWQPQPGGGKQAFEFRRPDGEWLWIAGLFENSEKYGMCYATITTEPPPLMVPIHDRMLGVLDFDDGVAFLRGETLPFNPYAGEIIAEACESPLKRKPPGKQGELF